MKTIFITAIICLFAAMAFSQSKTKPTDTAKNTSVSSTAFKMHFDDLFRQNADGSYSPIRPLEINGEMIGTDTKIANGLKYGGIVLSEYTHHDMLVDTERSVVIIRQVIK